MDPKSSHLMGELDLTPVPLPSPFAGVKKAPMVIRSDDPKHLATVLHLAVLRTGIPIRELARRMGISYGALYQYINGKKRNPSIGWLQRFLKACDARLVVEFDLEDQKDE